MSITLNEQDLQIIKNAELRIVNEINQICLRNNIKYSMIGGTLIGAVRHHGFIPWDDDIDLMMERSEYERFLSIAEKELSEEFYIADYEHTPSIGEPFTKIMMKNTVMKECFTGSSNAPAGIFVDIFPVDNAPESKIFKTIQRYKNYSLRKKILIKSDYRFGKTGVKKIIYDALGKFTFESKSDLVRKYRNNQTKYNHRNTAEYVSLCGAYGENIVLKSAGTQYYSYTYVADAVAGFLTVLLNGENGEAYNIADEASDIMLKDLAKIIADFAGKEVVFELPDETEKAGYSKATKARLDGSKLKKLGWKARYDIKQGLVRTLKMMTEVS